jgi:hypothetical protein
VDGLRGLAFEFVERHAVDELGEREWAGDTTLRYCESSGCLHHPLTLGPTFIGMERMYG